MRAEGQSVYRPVRLTARLGRGRFIAKVDFGSGGNGANSARIREPAHGDVQVVNHGACLDLVAWPQFNVFGRMGIAEQCDVESAIQRPVRGGTNTPVRG